MNSEIEETIKQVIGRQKLLSVEDISLDSTLEELGITSLDAISITFDIEDKYGIEIPNDKLRSLRTVRDLVEGMRKLLEADKT